MTRRRLSSVKLVPATVLLAVLTLTGCAGAASESPSATGSASASADEPCAEVTVVVEFGSLDAPSIEACAPAGAAADVLAAVDVTTEGTVDYGDQVVCRVNDLPAPDVESCATLPSAAYWALWVKEAADAEWAYAMEGVATLQLTAGQSVGLVYTEGTDSTPPQG